MADDAKARLRREVALLRREALGAAGPALAARVCAQLLADPAIRSAGRVALYAATSDELPSRPLFEALAAAGIERLLPRIGADGTLAFAVVARWEELVPGPFGVLAPPKHAPRQALTVGDVVAVPGVAFDRLGRRLGRGGGYYDRSFPPGGPPGATLIGMACEAQLVAAVPCDSHDRAMDAIVTERGLWWVGEQCE